MPFARDEAGNIWETDAQGTPIRLSQPAVSASAPATVAPNPFKARTAVAAERRADEDQGFQREQVRLAQQSAARSDAALAAQIANQNKPPEGFVRNPDGTMAFIPGGPADPALKAGKTGPKTDDEKAQVRNEAIDKVKLGRDLINRSRNGWFTTGFGAGIAGQLKGSGAYDVARDTDTLKNAGALNRVMELSAANGGKNPLTPLSNSDMQAIANSVTNIDPGQSDAQFQKNVQTMIDQYTRAYQAAGGLDLEADIDPGLRNQDDRQEAAGVMAGGASGGSGPVMPNPFDQPSAPRQELTSGGQFVADPGLAGANAQVRQMVEAGASVADIRSYLDRLRPGYGSQVQGIEDAVREYRANPNTKRQINFDLEKTWRPASGVSETLGNIGMSPFGSALIGAGDMASLGTLDNMTGNPDATRAVMDGLQQVNPASYLAGQVAGGVTGGLGVESLLGRAGVGALRSGLGADALLGAGYGAGSADAPEDDRVVSALLGAGIGAAGNAAGRGAARVAGRALSGVQDVSRRALNREGVRMTPGQVIGGAAKSIEDRLAGFPIVGDAINARRREGVQDFNRAAFREALAPVQGTTRGEIGPAGIDIARQERSAAYDNALDGVYVQADQPFVSQMQRVIGQGRSLPDPMRANLEFTLPTRVGNSFDQTGGLTGRDYQQSIRGLRRDANSMETLPYGYDFAEVTRGAEGALEGLLERQSPGVVDNLRAANEANRNVETLRAAVNAARNGTRSGDVDVFMPSQLSDAAAASAKKYGNSAGTTNQPFFDLTRAGQSVLPGQIPDSGTAGRMILPLLAGVGAGGGTYAAQGGEPSNAGSGLATGAVTAALLAAPYSQGARSAVQRALLAERGPAIDSLGRTLIDQRDIAGLLAAPSAIIYTDQ